MSALGRRGLLVGNVAVAVIVVDVIVVVDVATVVRA